MTTISVITPCFNAAEFIEATIESVRSQTLADWEHVVVDDGSTDDSFARVEKMAAVDARVIPVRQANQGVHIARNTGAQRADGSSRYLMFLDADDLLAPECLATLVDHLERHPDVGLVYCAWALVEQDGSPVEHGPGFAPRYVRGRVGIRELAPDHPETPLDALVSRHEAIPSTSVLRRSLFDRTAGWRRFGVVEDKDMVMQMALLAPVHFLPQRLTCYRRTESSRSKEMFYESLDELHSTWWHDDTLDASDLRDVRRAIAFDRWVNATLTGRQSLRLVRDGQPRRAATEAMHSIARFGGAMVLSARARASALARTSS